MRIIIFLKPQHSCSLSFDCGFGRANRCTDAFWYAAQGYVLVFHAYRRDCFSNLQEIFLRRRILELKGFLQSRYEVLLYISYNIEVYFSLQWICSEPCRGNNWGTPQIRKREIRVTHKVRIHVPVECQYEGQRFWNPTIFLSEDAVCSYTAVNKYIAITPQIQFKQKHKR